MPGGLPLSWPPASRLTSMSLRTGRTGEWCSPFSPYGPSSSTASTRSTPVHYADSPRLPLGAQTPFNPSLPSFPSVRNYLSFLTNRSMDPQQALEHHFGFREFREPQQEIISEILSGRDVFVVMPTGGGKSLCYQLPAILMDGVTIVVSPLVALMKDQVDSLV